MFDVSLIDNVHSDVCRLRGFYGHLLVEASELVLVEARSGADQARWHRDALKKWFCPKHEHVADANRTVAIVTNK